MAKRKTTTEAEAPSAPGGKVGTATITAMENAGANGTVVTITGAGPGGHALSMLAITPTKRTQIVEPVGWDGDEHTFELPYVATEVRVMEWLSKKDADEIVVQAVDPHDPDAVEPPPVEPPPTEPPPDPEVPAHLPAQPPEGEPTP